jgi:hypothetical protein
VKRGGSLSFLGGTIRNVLVMEIGWTDVGRIVPPKNERDPPLFTDKLLIKFQNILRNTTQVLIRHGVKNQIVLDFTKASYRLYYQKRVAILKKKMKKL